MYQVLEALLQNSQPEHANFQDHFPSKPIAQDHRLELMGKD